VISELLVEFGRDELVIIGEVGGHLVALELDRNASTAAGLAQPTEEDAGVRADLLVVQPAQLAPPRGWPRADADRSGRVLRQEVGFEGEIAQIDGDQAHARASARRTRTIGEAGLVMGIISNRIKEG
jgi:hypothetical protein